MALRFVYQTFSGRCACPPVVAMCRARCRAAALRHEVASSVAVGVAVEHFPGRLMGEAERTGKQARPPASLLARLNDAALEIFVEQPGAVMWPAQVVGQTGSWSRDSATCSRRRYLVMMGSGVRVPASASLTVGALPDGFVAVPVAPAEAVEASQISATTKRRFASRTGQSRRLVGNRPDRPTAERGFGLRWRGARTLATEPGRCSAARHVCNGEEPLVDGHPHTLSFAGGINSTLVTALGVSQFGQSGDVQDLYRHFGIDTETIVSAALDLSTDQLIAWV
jgi:hypothetical protein